MSESYWCLVHRRVEPADARCASDHVLGPYPDAEAAARALDRVADRNETWEEEEKRREEEDWGER